MNLQRRLEKLEAAATPKDPGRIVVHWPDDRVTLPDGTETTWGEYAAGRDDVIRLRWPEDVVFNVRYRDDDPRAKVSF